MSENDEILQMNCKNKYVQAKILLYFIAQIHSM